MMLSLAAPPPEIATAIELDTGILESEVGGRVEAELAEQLEPTLADAGYVIAPESATTTATATLRVRVITFDADAHDYEVEVELIRANEEPVADTMVCNACSENRLVGRILQTTSSLLEQNEAAPLEPLEPEATEPAVAATPVAQRVRAIGPMGITGVALGAVGIAGVSFGIERLLKGKNLRYPPVDPGPIWGKDYRPAGAVASALGAAMLITGVVLVAVDVKRRWRKNRNYALHMGRDYVGFQIEHRF